MVRDPLSVTVAIRLPYDLRTADSGPPRAVPAHCEVPTTEHACHGEQARTRDPANREVVNRRRLLLSAAFLPVSLLLRRPASAQSLLAPGDTVTLRCLGTVDGPRFLDGRTTSGTAGLAADTGPSFSGTKWRVVDAGGGAIALRCLGTIDGPRLLDGRTADGSVGLAPNMEPQFSGTRWQVTVVGHRAVQLRCLGTVAGPRFLDGRTADGSVGLAPNTAPPYSGTTWEVAHL